MTEQKNWLPDDVAENWSRKIRDDVAEEAAPAAGVLENDIVERSRGQHLCTRTVFPHDKLAIL